MSMTAALSRISEIQATIQEIRSGIDPATASASSTDSADSSSSADEFATALASATSGTSGTDGTSTDGTSSTGGTSLASTLATLQSLSGSSASTASAVTRGSKADAVGGSLVQNGTTGADVVADAKKYLGVPYVFGGTTTSGMDCSGLVQTVFKDLGISMPRVVPDQAKVGVAVPNLAHAQPGDIITTKSEGHVVIYLGDGKILHAPRPGKDVRIIDNYLKDSDIGSIRRIVPSTSSAASTAATTSVSSSASSAAATSQADLYTAALQQMMSGASA